MNQCCKVSRERIEEEDRIETNRFKWIISFLDAMPYLIILIHNSYLFKCVLVTHMPISWIWYVIKLNIKLKFPLYISQPDSIHGMKKMCKHCVFPPFFTPKIYNLMLCTVKKYYFNTLKILFVNCRGESTLPNVKIAKNIQRMHDCSEWFTSAAYTFFSY